MVHSYQPSETQTSEHEKVYTPGTVLVVARLSTGRGGWFRWDEGSGWTLYARFLPDAAGRFRPTAVHLVAPEGSSISVTDLAAVPLRRMEAMLNSPGDAADLLRLSIHQQAPGSATVEEATERWAREIGVADAQPLAATRKPQLRITVPPGRRRPDLFYERVARAYSWLAEQGNRPATELAEVNDVPVSTVHRWVKEARHRGLLGPGRRGGAG